MSTEHHCCDNTGAIWPPRCGLKPRDSISATVPHLTPALNSSEIIKSNDG
ncbi:hypothetical protein C8R45DRAFT_1115545 [Mycena sanguinolenta]|nr:hypothetical protein C8R45DRAFT_1115545 [Mycena sanguinolenta]